MIDRQSGARVGVRPERRGEPRTVSRVVPCEMVAVRYHDAKGIERQEVLIRCGGAYYRAPDSETWTRRLQPVAPWVSEGIARGIDKATAGDAQNAPDDDAVDVMEAES